MLISEIPVISVHIPPVLRGYTRGHDEVLASGETVGDVLEAVGHTYPELGSLLLSPKGELAGGLSVFIGGARQQLFDVLSMPVAADAVISLVATGAVEGMPARLDPVAQPEHGVISIGD